MHEKANRNVDYAEEIFVVSVPQWPLERPIILIKLLENEKILHPLLKCVACFGTSSYYNSLQ
jgi:hypothetical protein